MDRYVIRETRAKSVHPQGNQTIAFSSNAGANNNMLPPDNVYYGGSYVTNQFANINHASNSSYGEVGNMNPPMLGHNMHQVQGPIMTGMDPRYLSNYSDKSAQFIVPGKIMQVDGGHVSNDPNFGFSSESNFGFSSEPNFGLPSDSNFGANYGNRSFLGIMKNKPKTITSRVAGNVTVAHPELPSTMINFGSSPPVPVLSPSKSLQQEQIRNSTIIASPNVVTNNVPKKGSQNQVVSRAERLQALHKSGPRAFSGPVEQVLKWHKALQDIGVFIFYEIVAKCVNIRAGESCSKNLVIRDDNGPAIQVVYYEIDFLLPEIKVPSTVRVIGRMMSGTCRLQAFSVRPATGDDVAMLSRRAAVAAHHVAKLCKEYGINV